MEIVEREFSWEHGGGIAIENPEEIASRHPGPHVSGIIRDILNTVVYPGERRPFDELTPNEKKRMGNFVNMGFLWERLLEHSLATHFYVGTSFFRPGEQELDGIYGNPDAIAIDGDGMTLEEFKATWRSQNRGIEDPSFWNWFVQIKAYCHMLGLEHANLRVFWVNGNYRESGPITSLYEIRFTQRELQENWVMLRGHAKAKGWFK